MANSSKPSAIVRPNPDQLRDVLRFWSTGVTVVAASHAGVLHGMTVNSFTSLSLEPALVMVSLEKVTRTHVNSFTSLSLEPALVMVSLEKVTRTHGLVQSAGAFGVSILAQQQRELSDRFAGRESEISDRFDNVDHFTLEGGGPLLSRALAFFDCRVAATHDAGTHTLFIGEVLAAGSPPENEKLEPLVYFNRDYRRLKGF